MVSTKKKLNQLPRQSRGKDVAKLAVGEISSTLNKTILRLYGKFMNDEGTYVDYQKMGTSEEFADYEDLVYQLPEVDLDTLEEAKSKAFWINLYNVALIHGFVRLGVPGNAVTRDKFFEEASLVIGKYVFSLNDIEHGVLRNNSPHPASSSPTFSSTDSRVKFCLPLDPRIHFCLVCGAKSCPPIRVFTTENLENGLEVAAKNFCENNVVMSDDKKTVTLSMIFNWYGADFTGNGKDQDLLLKFIAKYVPHKFGDFMPSNIQWATYDWSLNGSH